MHAQLIKIWALFALTTLAHASDLQEYQGTLVFDKGTYLLIQGDKQRPLTGLSLAQFRHFEGQQVKLFAQQQAGGLEIYKVLRKQGQTYVAVYDWDVVNSNLYEQ